MFKSTPIIALIIALFFTLNISAQDKTLDTIHFVLKNPRIHDTTKLYRIALAIEDYNQGTPTMLALNDLMGKLALKNLKQKNSSENHKKYTMYAAAYYNNMGVESGSMRQVVKALRYQDKSIALFKSVKAYNEMNFALIGKAVFLSKINEYDKAIKCLFEVLKFCERDPAKYGDQISYAQSSLASIYSDQGLYEKSIAYNKKVIKFFEGNKSTFEDENRKAQALVNIGSSYFEMGDYKESMDYFNEAIRIFKKIDHPTFVSIVLTKIARVKMKQSNLDEAEQLLKEALTGDIAPIAIANANTKIGELYALKKDYNKADFYLTEGLNAATELKNLELQTQASALLFEVNTSKKNFEKALKMHQLNDQLLDSGKTESVKNTLARQQLKYDYEKKEFNYKLVTEKEKATKNNWLIVLTGFLLLLLLGGWFYYRNNKQKQAIAILEKNQIKQKLLVAQMNPHFIFN